jgi:hypothetical protein
MITHFPEGNELHKLFFLDDELMTQHKRIVGLHQCLHGFQL